MEKQSVGSPDNPEGESAIDRVNWAIGVVQGESLINQELLADLRQSLTAVCTRFIYFRAPYQIPPTLANHSKPLSSYPCMIRVR
jgi:hypothetical protein